MALLAALFLLLLAAAGGSSPAAAQETVDWRLTAGMGGGLGLSGHDLSDAAEPALVFRASLDRRVGGSVRVGMEWIGAWLDGAPGGDSRQALLVTASARPGEGPLTVRAGAGLGVATVADVDGPPPGPIPGDAVVSVGTEGGVAFAAGLGWKLPLTRRLVLTPAADLLVHRTRGRTLSLLAASARLSLAF